MGWRWAVVLYAQAVPFTLISFFMYWVDYRSYITENWEHFVPDYYIKTNRTLPTVRDDMFLQLELFRDHRYDTYKVGGNATMPVRQQDYSFRQYTVDWIHYANLAFVFFECIFNKIKIPFRQIWVTCLFIFIFVILSDINQKNIGESHHRYPTYPSNLNWNCENDWSFITIRSFSNETGKEWHNSTIVSLENETDETHIF